MKIGISMDAYLLSTIPVNAVKKLADIGFDTLDFNFSDYSFESSMFAGDDWKSHIIEIKKCADDNGIEISQIHSPFYMIIDNNELEKFEEKMMLRSFEACSLLGSPWAVIHSKRYSFGITRDNYERMKEYNIKRVQKLCAQAEEFGIGIALENIFRFKEEFNSIGINQTSDIIATVDGAECRNLCVCLDTGHAFCDGLNPADAARKYGERLKVLHVHDNGGYSDQHVAPYVGRINWDEFMKSLKEIDYTGAFSLEIHNYVQRMPPEIIDDAIRLSYNIAKQLVNQGIN